MKREFYPARSLVIDELLILLFSVVCVVYYDHVAIGDLLTWNGVFAIFGNGFSFILAGFISWAVLIVLGNYKIIPAGLVVWAGTVLLGALFRIMNGIGLAPALMITSVVFFGITLMGWRFIVVWNHRKASEHADAS